MSVDEFRQERAWKTIFSALMKDFSAFVPCLRPNDTKICIIYYWRSWNPNITKNVSNVTYCFLDGTFITIPTCILQNNFERKTHHYINKKTVFENCSKLLRSIQTRKLAASDCTDLIKINFQLSSTVIEWNYSLRACVLILMMSGKQPLHIIIISLHSSTTPLSSALNYHLSF